MTRCILKTVLSALVFFIMLQTGSIAADPVALVLGGGGARGAYHIGVWKALREMEVEIGGVYGVSVGAINGAMILQNDYQRAEQLWLNLDKDDVMQLSSAGSRVLSGSFSLTDLAEATEEWLKHGGINVSPLEDLLYSEINEVKVRQSSVDYGLMTYSLSRLSERILYLEDIPPGRLVEYILASANFPAFRRQVIDGQEYIDGGIYKNIAVEMVDPAKFSEAVVVSLDMYMPKDAIEYLSDYSDFDFDVRFIRPGFSSGSVLDFSSENAARLIKLGYLDCLRSFNRVSGRFFYLSDESDFIENMFLSLQPGQRRTAAELLEFRSLPELSFFTNDDCYQTMIQPAITVLADSDTELLEFYALIAGVEQEELYTTRELLGIIVDIYINRENPDLFYNKQLDFLSYLYLVSE